MLRLVLILIAALAALGLITLLMARFHWFEKTLPPDPLEGEDEPEGEACCGRHLVCEKDKRLAAQTDIVYYDDEELDAYREQPADTYDDQALEAFSEVFFSLRPDDLMGWLNSLRLRRIELPLELRDQALMMVNEQRAQAQ